MVGVDDGHIARDRVADEVDDRLLPAWRRVTEAESRLPVTAAVVVALVLQLRLSPELSIWPRWVLPALEIALTAVLVTFNPIRLTRATRLERLAALTLVAAIALDNTLSAVLLDDHIITGRSSHDAVPLLANAGSIYLTNVIAFGVAYWELDRGGAVARTAGTDPMPDFLFPQMNTPGLDRDWEPLFPDYLYVSFTNATAFSPTDTMPLTRWAKALMALQAAVALSTTGLVVARAVNILK